MRRGKFKDHVEQRRARHQRALGFKRLAVGDLANDGSLEVVINNLDTRPSLLKNFGTRKNWLMVRCVGTRSNRDAVGARVYVYVGDRRISGEIQTGASFLSQNDPRVHVGLADDPTISALRCSGPAGREKFFPAARPIRLSF